MFRDMVAAYPTIFLEGLKQTTESLIQSNRCSGRDSNKKPPKYKPETLARFFWYRLTLSLSYLSFE
jgi:hypothetical protein